MKKNNKILFAEGEWTNEPDAYEMTYEGYDCFFKRNPVGAWCGYIGVSKEEEALIEEHDLSLHGGITFRGTGSDNHPVWDKGIVVIGFDCAHAGDILPTIDSNMLKGDGSTEELAKKLEEIEIEKAKFFKNYSSIEKPTYKTLEFCKREVREFIDELINIRDK